MDLYTSKIIFENKEEKTVAFKVHTGIIYKFYQWNKMLGQMDLMNCLHVEETEFLMDVSMKLDENIPM